MNDMARTLSDASQPTSTLFTDSILTNERLTSSFEVINQRFFQGKIDASIIWQVPKGLISINKGTPCYSLDEVPDRLVFEQAAQAIEQGEMDFALSLLTPLADKGHPDSELLVCHMIKRQHGHWQRYAKAYNSHFVTEMLAPAACYYPNSQTIAIHPHLLHRDVPMFVLRYLIYHECCHQIIPSSAEEPHSAEFMTFEAKAPFREKSLAWLRKEGFPTLSNPSPSPTSLA
ncbi:MAG: hypothetical protein COA99_03730 [Moraxellaceae bacterium]|nr:MAG: hypothetical protein COA99_03730 [Moraxellaceae bacterium]